MSASRSLVVLAGVLVLVGGCHTMHLLAPCHEYCSPCQAPVSWAGIYPTVLTPWCDCNGGVDEPALAAQISYQLNGRVHGLLVLGTIGEGEYATMEERAQVLKVAAHVTHGCVPVVAGIHTCNLEAATAQLLQAKELGAAAVLVKYAGKPNACFSDVHMFYCRLAELGALPIFYYHYPSQTGLYLSPEEVAQILMLPGIVGIKESTLNICETEQHIALTHGCDKVFLSGTALNLTQFMGVGGHGAMCPEAALLPGPTVCAYESFLHQEFEAARAVQKKLFVVAPLLRGGLTKERTARLLTMTAQDHHCPQPMGHAQPQARLKAALNDLGICMNPTVKCCLPALGWCDRHTVTHTVRAIQKVTWSDACCGKTFLLPPKPCCVRVKDVPYEVSCIETCDCEQVVTPECAHAPAEKAK